RRDIRQSHWEVKTRRLHSPKCSANAYRDTVAAQNMNVIRSHLKEHRRPLYLQPLVEDGAYPWELHTASSSDTRSSASSTSIHRRA
ncbi:hypothetical protein BGX27_003902, partial [Mortierella sp. AM989]